MGRGSADTDALLDRLRVAEPRPESAASVLLQLAATAFVLGLVLTLYAWHARRTHAARELVTVAMPLVERGDPASLRLASAKLAAALAAGGARGAALAGLAAAHATLWVEHGFSDNRDTAHVYTSRAVEAGLSTADRYVAESLVALGDGRPAAAREIVRAVLTRGAPERLHWAAGVIALADGDARTARDNLARAVELKAQAPQYARALGDALDDLGNGAEAAQAWQTAARANPRYSFGVARDLLGRIRRGEDHAGVVADLQRESARPTVEIGPRARAALLLAEAELSFQGGALDIALRNVGAALGIEGESARLLALKGEILLAAGRTDEGLGALGDAHRRFPHADRYLYELVAADLTAGRAEDAMRLLVAQEAARSNDARWHVARGDVLLAQGALDKAAGAYNKALALDAGSPEALHGLGVLAWKRRDYDVALGWLEKALAARPKYPEVYQTIALMLAEQVAPLQADRHLGMAEQLYRALNTRVAVMLRFYATAQSALGATRNGEAAAKAWIAREKAYRSGSLAPLP